MHSQKIKAIKKGKGKMVFGTGLEKMYYLLKQKKFCTVGSMQVAKVQPENWPPMRFQPLRGESSINIYIYIYCRYYEILLYNK